MHRIPPRVRAAVALLGLALLPESEALARKPKPVAEPTPVYLRRRIARFPRMPACTPLQIAGNSKSITELKHGMRRWGPVTLGTKAYEEAGPAATFGECLESVAEYEGRYAGEQIEAFLGGQLTIGMPSEFAIMLLGLPTAVNDTLLAEPDSELPRPADFEWFPWRARIHVDAAGQIERLQLAGVDHQRIFVDATRMSVSSKSRGAVVVSSRQADYSLAMEAYDAGDHTGAFSALLQLAEAGHVPSQYAVGDMLYHGDGVAKDLNQAASWIGLAAESLLPGALYHLGLLQLRGEGVVQDPVAAYASMHVATQLGHPDAAKVIERLEQELDSADLAAARQRAEASAIRPPILIHRTEPIYPEVLRVARLEGRVVLQAVIGADGSVSNIEVLLAPRHGGSSLFAAAAIQAVSAWRYEPAKRRDTGEPVEIYFTIVIDFELTE